MTDGTLIDDSVPAEMLESMLSAYQKEIEEKNTTPDTTGEPDAGIRGVDNVQ